MKNAYDAVFLWDNLGPTHVDRANATVDAGLKVLVFELYASSHEYNWSWRPERRFELRAGTNQRGGGILQWSRFLLGLFGALWRTRSRGFFLCGFERPYIFVAALMLRLKGATVFVMQDSKFIDRPRWLPLEWLKMLIYSPYQGGLVAGRQSADYLRFLGVPRSEMGYAAADLNRLKRYLPTSPPPLKARPFVVVARMIPEKHLTLAVEAFARYRHITGDVGRRLVMVGDGPERRIVEQAIRAESLENNVDIMGWCDEPIAMQVLSGACALLLTSRKETFGNVVGEASFLGIPVLVSGQAGAADLLVRPFINGFVLAACDSEVWGRAMAYIVEDEVRWHWMGQQGHTIAKEVWDVSLFSRSVVSLLDLKGRSR